MNRSHRHRATLLTVLTVLGVVLGGAPAAAGAPGAAVVALGDSIAAGDGAGGYRAGTRGERGNWCHRSARAYVHHTGLAAKSFNLACSGASAADVAFGTGTHYTERSQAERLVELARRHRVGTVLLQVGANDDVALTDTLVSCIRAVLDPRARPCRETIGPLLADRLADTGRAVRRAVQDVHTAMRRAGYGPHDYTLVLVSYASPVSERTSTVGAVRGCPFHRADAAWGRTVLFPALAATLRAVATDGGARFLDVARTSEGREACSRLLPGHEWQRRLTVAPEALLHGGLGALDHLAQESFHPKAMWHTEVGRCLAVFVSTAAPAGACVPGPDGHLSLHHTSVAAAA